MAGEQCIGLGLPFKQTHFGFLFGENTGGISMYGEGTPTAPEENEEGPMQFSLPLWERKETPAVVTPNRDWIIA